MNTLKNIILLLSILVITLQIDDISCHSRIKLKDVEVITLHKDTYTTGRRSSALPQLKCTGKLCKYAPTTIQCYNRGFDGVDVNWECKSDLDKSVKFGDLRISCEGYDYSDDPYILAGSCGLEYSLIHKSNSNSQYSKNSSTKSDTSFSDFVPFIFLVGFVVLFFVFCSSSKSASKANPPPPGFRQDFYQDSYTDNTNFYPNNNNNNRESSGWGSFLSGAAVGAAASHLYNRREPEPVYRTRQASPVRERRNSNEESSGFASTTRR